MYAYRRVYGVDVEVKAVAARGDHVVDFAKHHGIRTTYRSFAELIADRDIDVVDICTPPNLHASMIVAGDAGRQARDLRKAVRRLFRPRRRQGADRQACCRKR